jgi:hypothetical protein
MKHKLFVRLSKLKLGAIAFLWILTGQCQPQYVGVTLQVETITRPHTTFPGGARLRRRTNEVHCVFGANLWMIDGDLAANARETWCCTGTNIVSRSVITKDLSGHGVATPRAGEIITGVIGPWPAKPLPGIAYSTWLAFCSGSFLAAEGRRILPPSAPPNPDKYEDKTRLFPVPPGLPERIELYGPNKGIPVCVYQAGQSTNFAGWTVPLQFELSEFQIIGGDAIAPTQRTIGTVTSIGLAEAPIVPPNLGQKPPP